MFFPGAKVTVRDGGGASTAFSLATCPRNDRSHPPRHRARITALQIAVTCHRPYREELRIAVVAQVEHARETGCGVTRLIPETVRPLSVGQIFDAANNRGVIDL